MTKDYFAELKKQPYDLFVAPKKYSFDLNEDMIKTLREEFNPEIIVTRVAEAVKGKTGTEIENTARGIWEEWAEKWMRRTMLLGEEYPDRTIEIALEAVNHDGNQFLFFPHVPQRFIEIAYLSIQQALKIPVIINNRSELAYGIPNCTVHKLIKEKAGEDVAKRMTCRHACFKALETLRQDLELDILISQPASTGTDGYCAFSLKKI